MTVVTFREQIRREFAPERLSIVEFAESEQYCGKPLYPRQRVLLKLIFLEEMEGWEEDILSEWIRGGSNGEIVLSPMIRERRDWLRESGYSHFAQYQLVGGRSSGKGYLTGIVAARKIYEAQRLTDPGLHYGIDPDKEIYFSCIAASLDQAKKYLFSDMVSAATRCKPLIPHLSKVMEEGFNIHTPADAKYIQRLRDAGTKVGRDWAKLRAAPQAANADTIRGQRALFLAFDEMAHMLPGESRSTAELCYQAAEPAMAPFGRDALIALQSSPYTKIGEFYDQYERAMEMDGAQPGDPTVFAFKFPSWALFEDRHPRMRVDQARIMVSPDWEDEKLNQAERAKRDKEKTKEKANPETYRVEYRADWAEAVDAYLNPLNVERAFAPEWEGRRITRQTSGNYLFSYAFHADPSSTTAGFGFAAGHVETHPHPKFPEGVKHVFFDLIKRWNPADFPEHTIDYYTVARDIADYIQWYFPYEVTFDPVNSVMLIQHLRMEVQTRKIRNPPTIFDVTHTNQQLWEKWEVLKTAMNLGLVHIPPDCEDSAYAEQELKFLQKKATEARVPRVEKQTIGPVQTKDMADCVREVVFKFIGQEMLEFLGKQFEQPLQTGAQGGYRIGGTDPNGPRNPRDAMDDFYRGKGAHGGNPARGFDPRLRSRRPGRHGY